MNRIENKKVVSLKFILKDDTDTVLDSSAESGNLHYIHGQGQILPVLEKALEGRIKDEKMTLRFSPAEAYGQYFPQKIWSVPLNRFDETKHIEAGQYFEIKKDEEIFFVVIKEITGDEAIVDANHPLAGKTLVFDLCVEDIREPSEEEIEMILKKNQETDEI